MKNQIVPLAVAVILIGIAAIANFTNVGRPTVETNTTSAVTVGKSYREPYDFVLSSVTAISNATHFNTPPEGFKILCSPDGKYVPSYYDRPLDMLDYAVRTSHWHAVIAAWRVKEIRDSPLPVPPPAQHRTWEECK